MLAIYTSCAGEADAREQLLEQLARLADERQPLLVLVEARSLADEHQVGVRVARSEHDLRATLRQTATRAPRDLRLVGLELATAARREPRSRAGSLRPPPDGDRTTDQRPIGDDPRAPRPARRLDVDLVALDRPSTARPTGESGETPPTLEISTVMRSPSSRSSSTREPTRDDTARRGCLLVDDLGVRSRSRSIVIRALEQALLVLRRVVLEVLGQVAVRARDRDRLDDRLAPRPLELGELGLRAARARRASAAPPLGHARLVP